VFAALEGLADDLHSAGLRKLAGASAVAAARR
jgi:hypothetical protein